ncbi:crossover junction endodeoxyribonuclease RuvC [bacterium TMED181]|nr:crossover junction endodeoxyribonuclease RuvC [Planctomycetota bacterium]OUW44000.1 MAG: crossover junction endodeoxyribonuclease RuvC [bacterium TMED181]
MNDPQKGRFLGIDPGLAKMGWGVIDVAGPGFRLVEFGSLKTGGDQSHAERLLAVDVEITRVIEKFQPEACAIEEVFQGKNARSALVAGEARGVSIVACARLGLPVKEISASEVKLGVTGNGRASKEQVQAMVQRILGLAEPPKPADAADALAVAIVRAQRDRRSISVVSPRSGGR